MSDNAAVDNNLHSRRYLRTRRKFAIKVYILFLVIVAISLMQWLPLVLWSKARILLKEHYYVSVLWLSLALYAITIFVFFQKLRHTFPINWILTIIIFEGVIIGLAVAIVTSNADTFVAAFVGVLVYVIILIILGVAIDHDLTLDILVLLILSVVIFISALFFVMLFFLSDLLYANYVFTAFVFITVSLFVLFHAQTICGNRFAQMRLNDYLLAALILYHDFVILFTIVFYLLSKADLFVGEERMLWPGSMGGQPQHTHSNATKQCKAVHAAATKLTTTLRVPSIIQAPPDTWIPTESSVMTE